MSSRLRWVEALDCMEDGPIKDLVRAAGHVLGPQGEHARVKLGHALDAVVDHVIEQHPVVLPG